MNGLTRRDLVAGSLTTGLLAASGAPGYALAQAPLRQARIVIGFPAGSGGDVLCRLFAEKMRGNYAQAVIVENKSGAAGRIGMDQVTAAPPDGASLLFTPTSVLTLYPHIYKKLSYDPFVDLIPLSRAATVTFALAVGPMVPAGVRDLWQFLAWCRRNPTQASFGSPGTGSSPHFLGATLAKAASAPLNHVPYRGTSAAVTDVLGGQIAAVMVSPGNVTRYAKTGQLRILAVTSPKRWELLPEVPTMVELGYPQVTNVEQFAFFIRKGTDAALVDRAAASIRAAASLPDVVKTLAELDMKVEPSRSADLAQSLRTEYERWGEIVKNVGFTAQD